MEENEELKQRLAVVEKFVASRMGGKDSDALTDDGKNPVQETSSSVGARTTNNNESTTMNRTQQRLLESIRTLPLNQSELECRRHVGPLPRFNGEPTQWFRFISTYRDTSAR